ncbi:hypothetical protein H6784_04585 [Candidatus Nomurabacteria bacterium]|nr:hypothetical protein [Candidatus Kaiserbacteria bacterium]MCB9814665.1 hypothetical protein [Candidatus Nomurabacteria bacterium]
MKPTTIGSVVRTTVPVAMPEAQVVFAPVVVSNLPCAVNSEQLALVNKYLSEVDFMTLPTREIATLGNDAEIALHRTLDGFLSKIDQFESPWLFQLMVELKEVVDKQHLPELADRILNDKPGMLDRFKGIFSRKALTKAMDEAWEETKRLASGKTKTLADLVTTMDRELKTEQQKLCMEIRSMEELKDAYRNRFGDFVVATAFTSVFFGRAKEQVMLFEQSMDPNNPVQNAELQELHDKLQALESRALALEGTLTSLPADQLVIRQLQNAGISTLQETTATASARFASIKMTLLTLHGALVAKGVQRLAAQGAALDANLLAVRGQLMKDVVTTSANAPGDNRLAQAKQLCDIVTETAELVSIVEQARVSNQQKFAQARQLFEGSRQQMLMLGKQIRPDQELNN